MREREQFTLAITATETVYQLWELDEGVPISDRAQCFCRLRHRGMC